jgi:DNA-binding beta-propeller fold protein YncE
MDDRNATNISTVKVTVNSVNHPPIANAGSNQTVNPGYVVTLDGSKSTDPDNDLIKYSWKQIAGPAVTLDGANTAIATFTAPKDISSNTDLVFELTVIDTKNATNTAVAKVTDKYIPPPNKPPIANAGTNQTVNSGDKVTLDGSGSKDPDGSIVSYSWVQTAGPSVTLNGAGTMTPFFTANVGNATSAILQFSLTVRDNKGAASNNPAYMTVTVKATALQPSSGTSSIPKERYSFVTQWGSNGTGDGQILQPRGIAIDSSGNVYVADMSNARIQKFDSNGNFITKWGSNGTGYGIAIDSLGNVYVVEWDNHRVQKFDSNGKFITKWGSYGTGDGQFNDPHGIAVDSAGNVYVADNGNNRIQKFDSNGNFITKWGSNGTGDGQFDGPVDIAVDSSGNVYVSDSNYRIQKFDSNGTFITKWITENVPSGDWFLGSHLTVDSSGNVYVSPWGTGYILKFDSNGNFITKWGGSRGTGEGQFNDPQGIAVDSAGNVYVADDFNHDILVFAPSR